VEGTTAKLSTRTRAQEDQAKMMTCLTTFTERPPSYRLKDRNAKAKGTGLSNSLINNDIRGSHPYKPCRSLRGNYLIDKSLRTGDLNLRGHTNSQLELESSFGQSTMMSPVKVRNSSTIVLPGMQRKDRRGRKTTLNRPLNIIETYTAW